MTDSASNDAIDQPYDVLIVGGGPIGLACGIQAKRRGLRYVIVEKGCLCNSMQNYPTHMRFFSTSELLEIGDVPFVSIQDKPSRLEALEYYRRVADQHELDVRLYERVEAVSGYAGEFTVRSSRAVYRAANVVIATGFFDIPRMMGVPGEDLDKVLHYYHEPHPFARQDVLVIGGANSAAIAALECYRHGARVTCAVRGPSIGDEVKYWIKPDIENRIAAGEVTGYFNTEVAEIRPRSVVLSMNGGEPFEIANDWVLALTGYMPDFAFLERLGLSFDDTPDRTPRYDEATCETNVPGVYLAGVVVGGMRTGIWFIENSRVHAERIMEHVRGTAR